MSEELEQQHNAVPSWGMKEVEKLEDFFKDNPPPKEKIITQKLIILNPEQMVESHLNFVRANPGSRAYYPYLKRLDDLRWYLKQKIPC